MVSTPSGITEAKTDELAMGAERCDREFSGSTSVRTEVKFAEV